MKIAGNSIINLVGSKRQLIDIVQNPKGQIAILSKGLKNPSNYDVIILSEKLQPLTGIRGSEKLCVGKFTRFQKAATEALKTVTKAL